MSEFIKWTYFCGCMYFCTHETSAQDQKFTPVKPTATCAAKSVDSLIIHIYIYVYLTVLFGYNGGRTTQ